VQRKLTRYYQYAGTYESFEGLDDVPATDMSEGGFVPLSRLFTDNGAVAAFGEYTQVFWMQGLV
jgi:hypothetical protein